MQINFKKRIQNIIFRMSSLGGGSNSGRGWCILIVFFVFVSVLFGLYSFNLFKGLVSENYLLADLNTEDSLKYISDIKILKEKFEMFKEDNGCLAGKDIKKSYIKDPSI